MVKQLGELQKIYDMLADEEFEILGFPSNQFSNQEPLENDEIQAHYFDKYGVTFPLFAKIDVNGETAHPLYKFLTTEKKGFLGGLIKWNYTKFLIDKKGNVVDRFAPTTEPDKFLGRIKELLQETE